MQWMHKHSRSAGGCAVGGLSASGLHLRVWPLPMEQPSGRIAGVAAKGGCGLNAQLRSGFAMSGFDQCFCLGDTRRQAMEDL